MTVIRLFSDVCKRCDCEFSVDFVNFNRTDESRTSGILQYHTPGANQLETVHFSDYHMVMGVSFLMYDVVVSKKENKHKD